MSSDLIIDVSPSEIVIALLENRRLVEISREKSGAKFAVGDIYLGKVKKIMPSLNAAFVDVGYEKDAFLHYLDLGPQFATLNKFLRIASSNSNKVNSISRIQSEPDIDKEGKIVDLLKVGQKILVQVAKEPIGTKGPRLTSEISIAGRNMVLMPFSEKISISQKIKSNEEKIRLKKLIQSIRPKKYGVIVRTAAEEKKSGRTGSGIEPAGGQMGNLVCQAETDQQAHADHRGNGPDHLHPPRHLPHQFQQHHCQRPDCCR